MNLTADDVMGLAPVIPVITIDNLSDAVPLAEALVAGGLPALEVTLRTEAALPAMKAMSQVKGAVVGAGTCLNAKDVEAAIAAGARFIVTPGLSESAAKAAQAAGVPILSGIATATELMAGIELGLTRFKFFPAEQAGGIDMLKAFGGPFGKIRFCPTGGISLASAPMYLSLPNVACVGGGWVAPKKLVDAKDWAGITKLASEAAALKL